MLVDRDDQSLLGAPRRDPAKHEVEPMPAHDHGLDAAPSLDAEAVICPSRKVRVEGRRPWIGCA